MFVWVHEGTHAPTHTCMHHSMHLEARGQRSGVDSVCQAVASLGDEILYLLSPLTSTDSEYFEAKSLAKSRETCYLLWVLIYVF